MSGWLRRLGSDGEAWKLAGVLLLSAAGLYWGWQQHWFLSDDAFIAFRFIDNRRLGFGYTWNPPPFHPVEGYTSFGWVVLLDLIWSLFGIEPPAAANVLALACACGSLGMTAWASVRLCRLHGVTNATWVTAAVLLATISQRTFLVWASGGLETALFNLLLQSWVLIALLAPAVGSSRTLVILAALAAGAALTRPDGLLAVAATLAMIGAGLALRTIGWKRALGSAAPLALVAAHFAWRLEMYREWLPNTYYAKVVAAWPEAGLRHAAAFVLEYAYYLAIPLWLWSGYAWARAVWTERRFARGAVQALALATVLAKLGFDVLIAGGDHFEYRVFSHLVPLLALAFAHGCLSLRLGSRGSAFALLGFAAVSAVLPWTIFGRDAQRWEWPAKPSPPLAANVAWPLSLVAAELDSLERWLVKRGVGVRHHEHRAFWLHQLRMFPSRERGARACAKSDHPVAALAAIGVGGWVLQGCAILDLRGLADYVIARTPSTLGYLGHDRRPPPDYVRRLMPNVYVNEGRIVFLPRPEPLTDESIRDTERYYWNLVRGGS